MKKLIQTKLLSDFLSKTSPP